MNIHLKEKGTVISLLFLYLICIIFFLLLSWIEHVNLINNGYVKEDSLSFTVDNSSLIPKIKLGEDKYILFQFKAKDPTVKHVYTSGDIQLPPISRLSNNPKLKNDVAIIGRNVNKVPKEYNVIGYFDTPNSYILNQETWIIMNDSHINLEKGKNFTFSTPLPNKREVFDKNIQADSINFYTRDISGTYLLKSNQLLRNSIKIGLVFLITVYLVIATYWIIKEQRLIRIVYMIGVSLYNIYFLLFKSKYYKHFLLSLFSLSLFCILNKLLGPLWSNSWLIYSTYLLLGFMLYILILTLIIIFFYTQGKGGKRY